MGPGRSGGWGLSRRAGPSMTDILKVLLARFLSIFSPYQTALLLLFSVSGFKTSFYCQTRSEGCKEVGYVRDGRQAEKPACLAAQTWICSTASRRRLGTEPVAAGADSHRLADWLGRKSCGSCQQRGGSSRDRTRKGHRESKELRFSSSSRESFRW